MFFARLGTKHHKGNRPLQKRSWHDTFFQTNENYNESIFPLEDSQNVVKDFDKQDDSLSYLRVLKLMVTPSYVFSSYLSVLNNSDITSQNSEGSYVCRCAIDLEKVGFHFCPANERYMPENDCIEHIECNDPIYNLFDLTHISGDLARQVPEYGEEYEDVANKAKALSVQLLDQCLNTGEVELLLDESAGSAKYFRFVNTAMKHNKIKYPRLMLAIELNIKEFVGHMYCQQMLKKEWYSGVLWQGESLMYKVSCLFIFIL